MYDKKYLELTRVFHAPKDHIWSAWTTPDGFANWYGKPWEVPPESVSMDVRVDGRWRSTTIAQGNAINFSGEFREVVPLEKLVLTIENPENPDDGKIEIVTVILKDLGDGKTEMYFKQEGGNLPPEVYDVGLRKGWTGFFDALQALVERK